MVQVQESVSRDTAPRSMPPGLLTPLPWPDWSAKVRSLDVGGVRADYVEMGPHQIVIPAGGDRPESPVRWLLVVMLEGISHGHVAGQRLTLKPRQAALIDGRAAMSFQCTTPIRVVRLFVEHRHLPPDVLIGLTTPLIRLSSTPIVAGSIGLVSGLLRSGAAELEQQDERVVSQPLIALLAALLREAVHDRRVAPGPPIVQESQRDRRKAAIDRYIDEHLADRNLRVGQIAAALEVAIRTVHAAFEDQGITVAAHVRARRIAQAKALLTLRIEPPHVAALADQIGLTRDQLTRAFRHSTGLTVRQWWDQHHEPRDAQQRQSI